MTHWILIIHFLSGWMGSWENRYTYDTQEQCLAAAKDVHPGDYVQYIICVPETPANGAKP